MLRVANIIVKLDCPASPVAVAFGSVRLNERAVVQFTVTDRIASAPFRVHVARVFDQIVHHVVFHKEKLVAAPVSSFHPGTVTPCFGHCRLPFPLCRLKGDW